MIQLVPERFREIMQFTQDKITEILTLTIQIMFAKYLKFYILVSVFNSCFTIYNFMSQCQRRIFAFLFITNSNHFTFIVT